MITSFTGEYAFLSNFYRCPFMVYSSVWPTAEHCYQASKAADPGQARWVATAETPGEARRRGRQVVLLPAWDRRRRAIMLEILLAKFDLPTELGDRLLATRPHALVEGSAWGDDFWGAVAGLPVYRLTDSPWLWKDDAGMCWQGRNWLGRLLMTVRDVIDPGA